MNKKRKPGAYKAKFTNHNLMTGTYILVMQMDDPIFQRKVVMNSRR